MDKIELEGIVENIIYQNSDNGYTVFSLSLDDGEDSVTCVGNIPNLTEGESVQASGVYHQHPVYGLQLNVSECKRGMPTSLKGIEKYLGSGVIKGIGEKLAKRIVARFGNDTFEVLEEYPEKLAAIKGISIEKAMSISALAHEQAQQRQAIIFMQSHGISTVSAIKLHNKYKEGIFDIIKTNPYLLADEVTGIGFKTADAIALKAGIERNSPFRIRAGIKYALWEASNHGHVYLPKESLINVARELMGISYDDTAFVELLNYALMEMQIERLITQEDIEKEQRVYLSVFHRAEAYVAKKLLELSNNESPALSREHDLDWAEMINGISLAEEQRIAVKEAMESGVLIITGGPGTGKTTVINTIITLMKQEGYDIELAAPTGRAAKRMTEATGMEAKTIHRLLGYAPSLEGTGKGDFEKDESDPLEADVIIIDESSMIDILLMYGLLKAVPPGSRVILVGDVDQLPSVGPGNVLKDLINSGLLKVVRLTEIFRQARESSIVMNAHMINQGQRPVLNEKNKDFFFVKKAPLDKVAEAVLELVSIRLPKYISCSSLDIQVMTPMRKSPLGVVELNKALQSRLNPPSPKKCEKEFRFQIFREGDKVMQIKNNYNLAWKTVDKRGALLDEGQGVYNGDSGVIRKIDNTAETLLVYFDDDRIVQYEFNQLEELELSYAITIHKSQGSEYKAVVIPVYSGPPMLMTKNLLYTAVTRARELVVMVGVPETMYKMIENDREVKRYTSLHHRLTKLAALHVGTESPMSLDVTDI